MKWACVVFNYYHTTILELVCKEVNFNDVIFQGVFVFKRKNASVAASPKKKVRRKSSKADADAEAEKSSTFGHFGTEKKGLDEFRADRFRTYEDLRGSISRLMADQQKQNFGKVLTEVENFVR